MTKDALKFFQAFVNEMIDVGGENLPKSISMKLGAKLSTIYKERGITNLTSGLEKSFKVLKGKPKITQKDDNILEIEIKYSNRFCPIGGKHKSERANLFQQSICIPFYLGFVRNLCPEYNYNIDIEECILSANRNYCNFRLTFHQKEGIC